MLFDGKEGRLLQGTRLDSLARMQLQIEGRKNSVLLRL
jgi:hypothetical protein